MPPPPQLIFGPMLVGCLVNCILYGVFAIQALHYYQVYHRDSTWLRYFVLYLCVAETASLIFVTAVIFEPLIIRYGTPEATKFFPRLLVAEPITTGAISVPVQIFIANRIRIISRRNIIPIIVCALAITSFGGAIWLAVIVVRVKTFAHKADLHWGALLWLLASAIADTLITTSLGWSLARRKTGFHSTDTAINRIIRLTIQTGLITTIFAILDVLCFLVLPDTTLNFVWDFALSKLYSNALLSTLNARSTSLSEGINRTLDQNNPLFGVEPTTTSTRFSFATAADPVCETVKTTSGTLIVDQQLRTVHDDHV